MAKEPGRPFENVHDLISRVPDLSTIEGLEAWLREQPREVAVAIASRAALRVLPFCGRWPKKAEKYVKLTVISAVFRANAVCRIKSIDKKLLDTSLVTSANMAAEIAFKLIVAHDAGPAGAFAAIDTAANALNTIQEDTFDQSVAARAAAIAVHEAGVAFASTSLQDVFRIHEDGVAAVVASSIWPFGGPPDPSMSVSRLREKLGVRGPWNVWLDWYDSVMKGVSRGLDYEIVFGAVPPEVWQAGPKAVDAWIREHLPREEREGEALQQRPALYVFRLEGERIAVAPEDARAEDIDATRDFLDEARRKARELRTRLARAQADERLRGTLSRLETQLSDPLESIRIGLAISSLTSLESDYRAYDSDEGRREHAPDLIASLGDLADTLRLFVGQFARAREILANQVALGLSETPEALERAERASEDLAVHAAAHPELVEPQTVDALREPAAAIARSRTVAERAKQLGLRLLTSENFARIVAATRQMAVDSLGEVQKQVPKAVGQAVKTTIVSAPAVGLALWLGPNGMTLLLGTVGVVAAINAAIGKKGGAFDRLVSAVEKVAARKAP